MRLAVFRQVLDMSVFGGPGSTGTLGDNSVMAAMETEILPEVNEVVTLICVFAIFKVCVFASLMFSAVRSRTVSRCSRFEEERMPSPGDCRCDSIDGNLSGLPGVPRATVVVIELHGGDVPAYVISNYQSRSANG